MARSITLREGVPFIPSWVPMPGGKVETIGQFVDRMAAADRPRHAEGNGADQARRRASIGMDMVAPFGVYVDGEEVACYNTIDEAEAHFQSLRCGI